MRKQNDYLEQKAACFSPLPVVYNIHICMTADESN